MGGSAPTQGGTASAQAQRHQAAQHLAELPEFKEWRGSRGDETGHIIKSFEYHDKKLGLFPGSNRELLKYFK